MIEDQSKNMGTIPKTQLDDQFMGFEDFALKARKPYKITKQREKWSQEDHNKFLEALKLYGRAWRRIQEHVGNKTAIQIRSHAQKFFSKVVRDSNGTEVEIPPPRAKKKPTRPYPRKHVDKTFAKSHSPESIVSTQSLKLFGKTVFVMDSNKQCSQDIMKTTPWNSSTNRASECSTTLCCSVDYVDLAYPFLQMCDRDEVTTRVDGENQVICKGEKNGNGFVVYKRCIQEKNNHTFMLRDEEREDLRVRLCL